MISYIACRYNKLLLQGTLLQQLQLASTEQLQAWSYSPRYLYTKTWNSLSNEPWVDPGWHNLEQSLSNEPWVEPWMA